MAYTDQERQWLHNFFPQLARIKSLDVYVRPGGKVVVRRTDHGDRKQSIAPDWILVGRYCYPTCRKHYLEDVHAAVAMLAPVPTGCGIKPSAPIVQGTM